MKEIIIIKIGGNVIDNEKDMNIFLLSFSKIKGYKILVHGGGKLATQISARLGIKTKMVEGKRITDSETLKVAAMVYAGWINKSIVGKLNSRLNPAIGLCGADVCLVPSQKRKKGKIDYGFVGDPLPNKVNTKFIMDLLKENITPVIAPITAGKNGQLLNTNADTLASTLAGSLSKYFRIKLIYCFEKDGVLNDQRVIRTLNLKIFEELKQKAIVKDGMIPKLENAFKALNSKTSVIIGNSKHIQKLIKQHAGTHITN